ETAFFVREGETYALRWFTPAVEVELCGHATLASAYVILRLIEPGRARVGFRTLHSGMLAVTREGERLAMDFPVWLSEPCPLPPDLPAALGATPIETHRRGHHILAVFAREEDVAALKPDFGALKRAPAASVLVTAPGQDGIDFVSRFFAPAFGIDEDPVTGSAHCLLTPYWSKRLGKTRLEARQISRRGGALRCALNADRVTLAGSCALYLEGTIIL
ncbi:MAG TPA: PhzF family phenazine biosynthesis protein, partial [Stellaceae bacterium]|nr:PhzF family phenazine biosynthesis protein [Stellaceae bacterium]